MQKVVMSKLYVNVFRVLQMSNDCRTILPQMKEKDNVHVLANITFFVDEQIKTVGF